MTTEQTAVPRPLPIPDEASQPFFDGAKEDKLLLRYCRTCDRWLGYAVELCDNCFSTKLEWKESAGKGTVYSFIIMHQVIHPGFASVVPYNVATVELEEGPRLHTNLVNIANDQIKVDMPVRVTFEKLDEDVTVPKFEPA
jgi:uncharacterized protein